MRSTPTETGPGVREIASALEAQRSLIVAAGCGGSRAVLDSLAGALACWSLLLDERGAARHASPPEARGHAERLRMDLERLELESRRHAASLDVGGEQVALLPIGSGDRVDGYLAVGRELPLGNAEHAVLAGAAGLLSLDLAHEDAIAEARRSARGAVLRLATGEHAELAGSVAGTLGVALPAAPVRVAVLGTDRHDPLVLLRAAENHPALNQASALVAAHDQRTVVVVLPAAEGDHQVLEEVLHQVGEARGAITDGVPYPELPDALRLARSVFFGSANSADRLMPAEDVSTTGLLAQLDTPGARGWAQALLEPLDRHASRSKLDLVSTLRVFLANNGHVDASASALGIHRHTLRYRLRRIVELLGTGLDDPTTRAELWLALRLREE
ncbi:PucR family transcriptional regulator [Saccharopolyspora griseoalba]|uniref:PucR family transcriptional regulator n=1 Tax=Saccharopolyspora griseoalba TaxID=1431848 RepID=A0ABW2LNA2_9PSEU